MSRPRSRPTSIRTSSPSARSTIRTLVNDDGLGFEDGDLPLPPAAITTDRPTCYSPEPPSPVEDYPEAPPLNFRHRVPNAFWENLPPLVTRATSPTRQVFVVPTPSPQASPTKSHASFINNRSTDTSASRASTAGTRAKHTSKASVFGNFFNINATSEPLNIGIIPPPRRREEEEESEDDEAAMESTYTRPSRPRRTSSAQTNNTTTSRFAWLTSKASALTSSKSLTSPTSSPASADPLLHIDVDATLFPHGPADPLDPTSFHDLLSNAESLISRLQSAYRAKCAALEDLRQEQAVQAEELDEAETRARHLRTQLEEMGRKMSEQEKTNGEIMETLVEERRQFREEEERRRRSIRRVSSRDEEEDLRRQHATGSSPGSDSGFESDPESENGSVFSGRSGIESQSSAEEQEARKLRVVRVKSVSGGSGGTSCRNCHGVIMGASDLRSENHMLKMRIAELEDAVEGCLDLVGGPWGLRP